MAFMPPSPRVALVETLVWRPAPFHSPLMGLGSKEMRTPNSSATRWRMKREIQRWSPTRNGQFDVHLKRKADRLTVNAGARANLVFPLRRHDLSVDAGDVDAGVQTSTVVGLDDVTAVDLAGTDTAVVRALGTGETTTGPAVGPSIGTEQSVLLFQTEPELLLGVGLHQASSLVAVVELVRAAIGIPGLTQDQNVVALAERVGEDRAGAEVDIGVVTGSLAGGGTVEVPLGELVDALDGLGEGLFRRRSHISKMSLIRVIGLVPITPPHVMRLVVGVACEFHEVQGLSNTDKKHSTIPRSHEAEAMNAYLCLGASAAHSVNPDVLSLDATALVEGHVLHELSTRKASQYESFLSGSRPFVEIQSSKGQRTFSVLEMTVESA